jgi:hypothetical protein
MQAMEKSVLLECGIGFGKTFVGCLFITTAVFTYGGHGQRFMIAARDNTQLKNAVLPELFKVFSLLGLEENIDYKVNRSDWCFTFDNGTIVTCASAHNYDTSFRGPNISILWGDEVDFWKPDAWDKALGRVRVYPELIRATSSPDGFNHIHSYFYSNADEDTRVINAPTWENLNLSAKYLKTLKNNYSPRLFEQECGAKRLRLKVGAVYNEFDRERHVKDCRHLLKDTDQLYFFVDYNIANYCGVYLWYDKENDHVYAYGEEHLQFEGSKIMAQTVKARWTERPIIVCGDSAGNNKRDTSADKVNYQHFKDEGLLTEKTTNPPVNSRIISSNSNFYHNKVTIDPSCKTLIKDLELLAWKEDGSGIEKTIDLSHSSDAYTYGLWKFVRVIKKKKSGIKVHRH